MTKIKLVKNKFVKLEELEIGDLFQSLVGGGDVNTVWPNVYVKLESGSENIKCFDLSEKAYTEFGHGSIVIMCPEATILTAQNVKVV